jgi:ribosome maturation factor RimP
MERQETIQAVTQRVEELLQDQPGYFLVRVLLKPVDNLKVYLDADQGVSIEKCVSFNRKLYRMLVEQGVFADGAFSLEVSSPGVDEPLHMHRQYLKNKGRQVEVVRTEGGTLVGRLTEVTEDGIAVETVTGKGRNQVTQTHTVLFPDIRSTTVQVTF